MNPAADFASRLISHHLLDNAFVNIRLSPRLD